MKPDSRYSLAEHKVDSVLEMLRGRSPRLLLPENDSLLKSVLDDLASAMEELRAAHAEVDAQREGLDKAYQYVQRERQRYVELFEDAPDGYVVTDLYGCVEQANIAAVELLNSARDFIVGKPLALFVNKEDRTAFFQRLNEMDTRETLRDWELLRRYALLARHGRDIVLFMRREDGRILEANTAAVKAYGYDYENLLMLTIHDLRAPDTQLLTLGQMAEAESAGILFETAHRRKDGSIFSVEVSFAGRDNRRHTHPDKRGPRHNPAQAGREGTAREPVQARSGAAVFAYGGVALGYGRKQTPV